MPRLPLHTSTLTQSLTGINVHTHTYTHPFIQIPHNAYTSIHTHKHMVSHSHAKTSEQSTFPMSALTGVASTVLQITGSPPLDTHPSPLSRLSPLFLSLLLILFFPHSVLMHSLSSLPPLLTRHSLSRSYYLVSHIISPLPSFSPLSPTCSLPSI